MDELIRKQDVLEIKFKDGILVQEDGVYIRVDKVVEKIKAMPPVQPKRGKWMPNSQFYPDVNTHWIRWECSECGYTRTKGWEGTTDGRCPEAKICENCGADMTGNDDGTD